MDPLVNAVALARRKKTVKKIHLAVKNASNFRQTAIWRLISHHFLNALFIS